MCVPLISTIDIDETRSWIKFEISRSGRRSNWKEHGASPLPACKGRACMNGVARLEGAPLLQGSPRVLPAPVVAPQNMLRPSGIVYTPPPKYTSFDGIWDSTVGKSRHKINGRGAVRRNATEQPSGISVAIAPDAVGVVKPLMLYQPVDDKSLLRAIHPRVYQANGPPNRN